MNPNADNSARFSLGTRDGVGMRIQMRMDASIQLSVVRIISQWYRNKQFSPIMRIISVGVANELRKFGQERKKEIGGTGRLA